MILFTDSIFVTDEREGFRICRETRTTSAATMTVLFCRAGFIDVYYHGEMVRIHEGDLFVRIPDFAHELGPYEMSPDFEFQQVTVSANIFSQIMFDHMRVEPNWWQKQEYVKLNPIFQLNEKSKDFFESYFHLLVLQMESNKTEMRLKILHYLALAASMEVLHYMDKLAVMDAADVERVSVNQSDYTFRQYMKLLQEFPHEREVQWYAKQLNITPKYLSEICKSRSGKSAGDWIAEITVAEIKHYLRNTTMPIRDIAAKMEFPNASFFCQYTKKHTGKTPNRFRKTIN